MIKYLLLAVFMQAPFALAMPEDIDLRKFAEADWFFAQRDQNNPEQILQTIAIYDALIPQLSGSDLFYAVGQANRLSRFLAESLANRKPEERNASLRIQVLSSCAERTQAIDRNIVDLPESVLNILYRDQFLYWRLYCLYKQLPDLNEDQTLAISNDLFSVALNAQMRSFGTYKSNFPSCYEGGGLMRLFSEITLDRKNADYLNGYHPDSSYEYFLTAQAIEKRPEYYCKLNGRHVFENYLDGAKALVELGQKGKALSLIEDEVFCRYSLSDDGSCDRSFDPEKIMLWFNRDVNVVSNLPETTLHMEMVMEYYKSLKASTN